MAGELGEDPPVTVFYGPLDHFVRVFFDRKKLTKCPWPSVYPAPGSHDGRLHGLPIGLSVYPR